MSVRREKVVLETVGMGELSNHFARMRRVVTSMVRNDRARRENLLYAADPKRPGPQLWEGDQA